MDPLLLAALIQGGGGLLSGLSGLFSQQTQPENINAAQTQAFTQLLEGLMQTNQASLDQSLLDASRTTSQISNVAAQQGQITQDIANVQVPGADDWFTEFTSKYVPAYQQIAQQTAEAASQLPNAQERADRASSQGVTAALDQFAGGGAYSGAAARSAAEAAVNPQLDYLNQVDQAFGQAYGSTFQNLANQGQQLSFQGQQNEFLNNIQQLQAQLGGLGQQGQTLGTSLQGSLGQAGQYNQMQSSVLGQLGQLSQPVYSTPSYTESPFNQLGGAISGLGSLLGSYNQQDQLSQILAALQG